MTPSYKNKTENKTTLEIMKSLLGLTHTVTQEVAQAARVMEKEIQQLLEVNAKTIKTQAQHSMLTGETLFNANQPLSQNVHKTMDLSIQTQLKANTLNKNRFFDNNHRAPNHSSDSAAEKTLQTRGPRLK
jgi:hypothetical protein